MHEEKTMSSATNSEKADLEQPKTPQHSDNKASKMPDRPDDERGSRKWVELRWLL
jgi:hypothetical protein